MLGINLQGKRALITGVGDDQGYAWAIAKVFAEAGCEIILGVWPPILGIFTKSWEGGKFDASRSLSNGTLWEFAAVYPLDAAFDTPEQVPQEIKENKRYQGCKGYTIREVVSDIERDFGTIDVIVHALGNAPEVKKPLLQTSREGYLSAVSVSSYSLISLLAHCAPLMPAGGAVISLTYLASERVVPAYGGGMSSAKAALESDTRTLAWEAGRAWGIRVNTISAGPLRSRAARAIGFIDKMIEYCQKGAPLGSPLQAEEVGYTAAFLCSPLASGITGSTIYVDKGMHTMGVGPEISEGYATSCTKDDCSVAH